jgi:RimJ/RimL family protein N-acetyltransferase
MLVLEASVDEYLIGERHRDLEHLGRPGGRCVTICRPPREEDLAVLASLRNDLPTQYALLAVPRVNSLDDVRSWIARRTADPAALFYVIADEADDAVGFTQVVAIDENSRHGRFGIAIDGRHRGRGHGRAATEHLFANALADGRLEKLVLYVAADNTGAWALYRSLGFRDVGVHRRHYRAPDGWHDVAVMERFLADAPSDDSITTEALL